MIGLLAAGLACGTKAPAITGVTITVTFPASSGVDQLALGVSQGGTTIADMPRPKGAGAALASPQSVSIFLADALADMDVTCTATGLAGGVAVTATGTATAHLALHQLVPVTIDLAAGDAAVPEDAGGDAPATGGAGGSGGTGGSAGAGGDMGAGGSDAGALKANGVACLSGGECDSTQCVDGVCCGSVCNGKCESCNQKGNEGTCTPLAAGTPTTECVDQGTATCGFDGTCDGNGACRKYGAGTPCKVASCDTSTYMPASACDGQGVCVAPNSVSCAPYLCDASGGAPACRTTCQVGGVGCATPAVCTAGSCGARVLKANGDGCVAAGDCTSNHCVDGVCCETACAGTCMACNVPGFAGLCHAVPAGKTDPRNVCKDAGAASCKQNGLCNGAGACALYPASTTCFAGACSVGMVIATRRCDGAGTCAAAPSVDCAPYRCNPATTTCFASCTTNAQCSTVPKRKCNGNNMCQ